MQTLDDIRKAVKGGKTQHGLKPGTLEGIRAQLKAGKLKPAKPVKPVEQTTPEGKLLVAIARANGHTDPQGWAAKAMGFFNPK
jgi:hypothetical protein